MRKSFIRWQLRLVVFLACSLLVFSVNIIWAQEDTPPAPETPTASPEVTETEVLPPEPTDLPVTSPTEEPTAELTDEPPVIETETPIATETSEVVEVTETPVPSEEPVTVEPPTPMPVVWSILVRESFNNGDLSPWLPGAGWSIVANSLPVFPGAVLPPGEIDQALQVVNSNDPIQFQKQVFFNVAAETSFLISQGSAQLTVRQSAPGMNYTAAIDAAGLVQLYRNGLPFPAGQSGVLAPAMTNPWRTLHLSAVGGVVRVLVDGVELIVATDTEPIPPGYVTLSGAFGDTAAAVDPAANVLLADNFFVWVPLDEIGLYPSPTPVPTLETVPPTEIPTETPAEIPTEVTAEPTDEAAATVEATAEVTEVPVVTATETPVEEVEATPPPSNVAGKDTSAFPAPSPDQLINAFASNNDDFTDRISIGTLPFVDSGDTTAATLETGEPSPTCGFGIANTIWFSFTPAATASYTLSTAGSSFDTILAVYTGTTLNDLVSIGCNDDASTSLLSSQLTMTLNASTTYYIQVGGYNGRYGNVFFRLTQGAIPAAGVPVLVSPASGAVLNDSTPSVSWNPSAGGYTYEVQLATAANFAPASLLGTFPASISTTLDLTLPGPGTYYWRVRALNVNGVPGNFSAGRSIVYRDTPPGLSAPADNSTTTDTTPLFRWLAYGTGAKYDLEISQDSTFDTDVIVYPNLTTTSFTPPASEPLLPGVWYWRVQAHDVMGNPPTGFGAHRAVNINNLSSPAANAITSDTTPTFSWVAFPGTNVRYRLEISADPGFGSLAYTASDLTTLNHTLSTPLVAVDPSGNGTYYWRVKVSTDGGATYQTTDPLSRTLFISPPKPLPPVLVNPAASAATIDTTPTLDWNPTTTAVGGPFNYDVQVCANAACNTTIYDSANVDDATDHTLSPLTPLTPGTYYWRVRTVNAFGVASNYSAARAFIVRTDILSAPANDSSTTDTTPRFTWLPVPYSSTNPANPVRYRLEVYEDAALNTLAFSKGDLATTNYTMVAADGELAHGDYWWTVSVSGNSSTYEFTSTPARKLNITSSIPAAPTFPAIPANGATLANTTPTLQWNDVAPPAGASWTVTGYELQIATNAAFSQNLQEFPTAASEFPVLSPLADGTYYFRVRTRNSHGALSNFSAVRSFKIRTTPPVQSAPADGLVTTDTTPVFTWVTFGTGSKYHLQVADDPSFGSPVIDQTNITTTSFTVPNPGLAQGVWYWHVRAIDVNGFEQADYSAPRTLYVRTQPVLPAPVLTSPATGFITKLLPLLDWNAVTPPAGAPALDHYEVQIATNATFTNIVQTGNPTTDEYQVTPTGISEGTYYWRVRAFNTAGIPGAFSASRRFIVDTTGLATLPNMTAPANNASTTVKTPTFTWTKPVGATSYELRFSLNYPASYTEGDALNTVGTVIVQNITSTSYKWPAPLIPGTYYWQVQAFDAAGNGSGWTTLRPFKITSATTDTPVPHRFGDGDPILLTWGPLSWVCSACANPGGYYEVQVDNNSNFSSPEYQRVGAPGPTGGINHAEYITGNNYGVVIPNGALPNGTWYWRVRGFNPTVGASGAYGAYSSTGTFTIEKSS